MKTCQTRLLRTGNGGFQVCNSLRILELTDASRQSSLVHQSSHSYITSLMQVKMPMGQQATYCCTLGEAQSTLMAKARVAPLKSPTIPRTELTAATVAVKMDKLFKEELDPELHDFLEG